MADTSPGLTLELTPLDDGSGWRLRETPRFYVDALPMMLGNVRIVITPKADPTCYTRGWCYTGGLLAAAAGAAVFDPDAGEEPTGWVKEVGTERRPCGSYLVGPRQHHTYVAGCPACGDEGLYR